MNKPKNNLRLCTIFQTNVESLEALEYLNTLIDGGLSPVWLGNWRFTYIIFKCIVHMVSYVNLRVPSTTLPNKSHTPNNEASYIGVIDPNRHCGKAFLNKPLVYYHNVLAKTTPFFQVRKSLIQPLSFIFSSHPRFFPLKLNVHSYITTLHLNLIKKSSMLANCL